ncbi:MAG: DnaD domain protein [Clostridia bacterium]|nr:DnaD domain protein [Clostridia bacterium]
MKYKVVDCGEMIAVPRKPVTDMLEEADSVQLKVLMYVLSQPEFTQDDLCEKLDITKKRLTSALSFWEKAGAIEKVGGKSKAAAREATGKLARASELPKYTSEEIAEYIESHAGVRQLLNDCQHFVGKMFNLAETEIIIGLLDYLKLDEAYISLLFAHCTKNGKKSLRYIEKMAIGLFDKGIISYEELDEHLCMIEAAREYDKPLRKLFGIGPRALTKKEQDAFDRWCGKWKMPFELIERAFEVTVENCGGRAPVDYCNAVLSRWFDSGYKTVEEVEEAMTQYKHDKGGGMTKDKKGSFDEDDFFEAALRRSYGNDEM